MAVVGNLALLLDFICPRTIVLDRKTRSVQLDVLLNFFKKEPNHTPNPNLCASLSTSGFEFEKESRNKRTVARGKMNSRVNNAMDYESSSDDEANGNGYEDDEETDGGAYDWEKEMRKRLREIEEMKELERKAAELHSRMADEGGDNDGEDAQETEEQKRMRVRKELEKVRFLTMDDKMN